MVIRPVPLRDEEFVFIDRTQPIRAVYFPIAHKSEESVPSLCTYLMVEFRNRGQIRLRHPFSPHVRFKISRIRHGGWVTIYRPHWAFISPAYIKYFRDPDNFGVVNGICISPLYGERKLSFGCGIRIFSNILHVTAERPRLYDRLISQAS